MRQDRDKRETQRSNDLPEVTLWAVAKQELDPEFLKSWCNAGTSVVSQGANS